MSLKGLKTLGCGWLRIGSSGIDFSFARMTLLRVVKFDYLNEMLTFK